MPFVPDREGVSFEGHTILVPGVSHGNVGQLACDLLISTQRAKAQAAAPATGVPAAMRRVGHFHSEHLSSIAGNDPFATDATAAGSLTVNGEVYQAPEGKVSVLQLRAGHARGHGDAFVAELVKWAKSSKAACLVCLAGANASTRTDAQMEGSQIRYVASAAASGASVLSEATAMGLTKLEEPPTPAFTPGMPVFGKGIGAVPIKGEEGAGAGAGESDSKGDEVGVVASMAQLHGVGMARRLMRRCEEDGVALVVLSMFVSEGDNRADGVVLAGVADALLGVVDRSAEAAVADAATGAAAGAGAEASATDSAPAAKKKRSGKKKRKLGRWVPPASWEHAYGSAVDDGIYL